MSHDRDHDHPPVEPPPKEPKPPLESKRCPDRKRREHPGTEPREPVDPRPHPSRPISARARPA